ncbi:Cmr1p [Saccharomyces eubayanus]|uniref:Cmr1p n=1 Tax=Saccharomyces eubayanus TaxID=1080349 RepID=UPI0006C11F17|nr:CMR1-like protein [Saccharomyces eubayanus]KOH00219.1 CMR1-like protein [Saccharomyces eubayanus]
MPELTEFQRKRQENIKRNNDLLKKLHLSGVASQIKHEAGVVDKAKAPVKKKQKTTSIRAKKSASPSLPTRRSRRLRGEAADNTKGIPDLNDNQLLKMGSPDGHDRNFIDEMKEKPVIGDVKLSDLIKDENEDALLEKFKRFNNGSFSSGDFFDEIKKRQGDVVGMDEFDLDLYDVFQPNEIKVTYERISATYFHPAVEKKLIIAGDTGGTVGFWNVRDEPLGDSEEDRIEEPDITRVKLFTKNVGRIDCFPTNTSKILLTSYDGSIRSVHLNNLKSEEVLTLKNEYDDPLGISDCQFSYENPHVLFLTTLGGEFTTFDTRAKTSEYKLRRLADKKIGSMAINPLRPYEIATGSLDRTLKIWDTRNLVEKPEWSQYEDHPSHEIVSTYDSRLSVSAVSYSPTDGTLVCNGYDDTVRLFDVKSSGSLVTDLQPKLTIQHNCQTGRWTSILKARFKPNKNVFAIANMKRAIDIYNSDGQQLAHLPTATVPAVVSWHPLQNWIAGGNSSGKIFLFSDDSQAIKQEQ